MVLTLNAFLTIHEGLSWQWLRLHTSTVGDMNSTPGQGTKILYAMLHGQKFKQTKHGWINNNK